MTPTLTSIADEILETVGIHESLFAVGVEEDDAEEVVAGLREKIVGILGITIVASLKEQSLVSEAMKVAMQELMIKPRR